MTISAAIAAWLSFYENMTVDTNHTQGELLNVPLTLLCNDPESPRLTIRLVGIIDKE